ncbi:MAG: hypothetical protein ACOX0X_02655 [Candidatus Dojkabacteria bacterium]
MRKIKTLLLSTLISLTILSSNVANVFADGSPYDPYGPHKPVPTGLEDLDILVFLGIASYIGGVLLITGSKFLKKKVLK